MITNQNINSVKDTNKSKRLEMLELVFMISEDRSRYIMYRPVSHNVYVQYMCGRR